MSLPPVIVRDIGEEVPAAERVVYAAFVRHLETPTSPAHAILRTARECGIPRQRVIEIVRARNPLTGILGQG